MEEREMKTPSWYRKAVGAVSVFFLERGWSSMLVETGDDKSGVQREDFGMGINGP